MPKTNEFHFHEETPTKSISCFAHVIEPQSEMVSISLPIDIRKREDQPNWQNFVLVRHDALATEPVWEMGN
jgi:hypothetical protein